jgi:hypothetical protein
MDINDLYKNTYWYSTNWKTFRMSIWNNFITFSQDLVNKKIYLGMVFNIAY